MKLHEYQAKELFARYAIPVQNGVVIDRPQQVEGIALTYPLVLKAQVLVGGRGNAGGIKLDTTDDEARRDGGAIVELPFKGEKASRWLVGEGGEMGAAYYLAVA